jgi:Carotenoid biosynthesis protein
MRNRILLIAACVLLAIFAYDGVVRLLLIGLVRLPKLPVELTLLTSILALFSLTHAWYSIGGRQTAVFFGLSAVVSWAYEQVGVATGLVFGAYHYTDYLGPKLGNVPYLIPLAWFMMIYPSYVIANLVLAGRATGTRPGLRWLVGLAAGSALAMTVWDLVVDPILSGPSARAWVWESGGPYFGIPIQNYAGWLLTTFTVYLAYRAFEQRAAAGSGAAAGAAPLGVGAAALPVAAYGLMLVSDLLSGVEPAGVAVVGPLVMGPPVLLAAWRLAAEWRPALLVRERLLAPVPWRLRYLRARLRARVRGQGRGQVRGVLFYPGRPNSHHILYKLFHAWGWRIGSDPEAAFDFAVAWRYPGTPENSAVLRGLAARIPVLNLDCGDVSKRRVDAAAAEAFGYDIRVDPISYAGPCVRKSDANARHDGVVVMCPTAPEPGYVYQRVVDNGAGDGLVEDIRLPVLGELVPFAYRKRRRLADRFSNTNVSAEVSAVADVMSPDELRRVLAVCRAIGLDYGEVDVLRDRGNGKLYVVDANPTPYGPPNHISRHDAAQAMAMLGEAFEREFGEQIRGA